MIEDVDVIVIGSGQGGVPLAATLATRGQSVVLFERASLGGTCVNSGCTPSKAFLASAHAAGRARAAHAIGVSAEEITFDFPAVMERVRGIIAEWRSGVQARLAKAHVRIVAAEASFVEAGVVTGGGVTVRAPFIVIDTGQTANIPPIAGLRDGPFLDNVSFFAQTTLPERSIVLGGGYIGLELGQGLARAGSAVTLIHPAERLLEHEEADASEVLREALADDGVDVRLRTRATRVAYHDSGVRVTLDDGTTVEADMLLVATGRVPASAALHCERAGITCDERGIIVVDEQLQTTSPGTYAIGDVAGQPAFTHVAWEDHRRLLDTLDGIPRTRADRVLAYSTFTEPQLARVGLTVDAARAAGHRATAVTMPMTDVARAIEWNVTRGFLRMVVDDDTDAILGATFIGYECGELIHVPLALIHQGSTWQRLAESMYVHPTLAEALPTLARMIPDARGAARVAAGD